VHLSYIEGRSFHITWLTDKTYFPVFLNSKLSLNVLHGGLLSKYPHVLDYGVLNITIISDSVLRQTLLLF